MKTFAERLRRAMDEADMSQSELAVKAGVSKAAVSQYLSGKNTPSTRRIRALAEATGVPYDTLIGYDAPGEKAEAVIPARKITTDDAARCLGKSRQFVRVGLQRGILPFGSAVPSDGKKWSYYINPARFREYVGAEQFDSFFGASA